MKRKHIHLRFFDYSSEEMYFITIRTRNQEHFFGEIENGEMILNEIGVAANYYMNEIPKHFNNVKIDEMIVMPNHVHCILMLDKKNIGARDFKTNDFVGPVGPSHVMALPPSLPTLPGPPSLPPFLGQQPMQFQFNKFSKPVQGSVSVIIQQYKSAVTRWCNENGHKYFGWQVKFHDHVIRDYESYVKIKNYIINNPKNWYGHHI